MKSPSRPEFIVMTAAITMVVAFAIDTMLPALPVIGRALHVAHANDPQFILTAFVIGLGAAQFVVGIASDSLGRRALLIASLALYALCGLAASTSPTFGVLLAARFAQGLAAGGARVVAVAIVRDRFAGREMAQVMSFVSVVFMAAPVVAPSLGTLILHVANWRRIFDLLALVGAMLTVWIVLRLPETLPRADRVKLAPGKITQSIAVVINDRQSLGYTLALTLLSACIFAYLASVQQIYDRTLGNAGFLPIGFAIMALTMACASLLNARIVIRYGMRRIGHLAVIGFVGFAFMHLVVAVAGRETLWTFIVLQSAMMGCFPLAVGNFSALAMERMGNVAGTASSLQGSFSTVVGASCGTYVGQWFDGTTVPLYAGTMLFAALALATVLMAEGGRLLSANAPVEAKV